MSTDHETFTRLGRVWKFGDSISTDVIMPGAEVLAGRGLGRQPHEWCFHAIRPGWSTMVTRGDIIIAGRNFGCGSGRNAPSLLRAAGVGAVIAESIARTFFRSAVSGALPAVQCTGVMSAFSEGDMCRLNVLTGEVENVATGTVLKGEGWPLGSPPNQILAAGGFEPFLRRVLQEGETFGALGMRGGQSAVAFGDIARE